MKLLPTTFFKPLCTQQPKTSSFRITTTKDDIYKTINSVYFDTEADTVETPDSWFTNSSESGSVSTTKYKDSSMSISGESHLEAIVRGAQQSDNRLFFDPGESDSPRLQIGITGERIISQTAEKPPFKKSVAMSLESEDPYEDFKKSMEEMVESLGVRYDWEGLEELLRWYLKVNGRETHGYIINAFVDLLAGVQVVIGKNDDHEISKSTTSFASAASSLSSSASSTLDPIICKVIKTLFRDSCE